LARRIDELEYDLKADGAIGSRATHQYPLRQAQGQSLNKDQALFAEELCFKQFALNGFEFFLQAKQNQDFQRFEREHDQQIGDLLRARARI